MKSIKLVSNDRFSSTAEELKNKLDEKIKLHQDGTIFANSEASFLWIIRGCIDYFDELAPSFLGVGNASGIPDMQADHFANNIYRLFNAIKSQKELWKLKIEESNEMKLLIDIRTLIAHSGEQLNKIKSLDLKGYKDSQLGRIYNKQEGRAFHFNNEFSKMDYCITVWNDKRDKGKKHNLAEVDYHLKRENYIDVEIYLKAEDVRNIVLRYVETFLNAEDNLKKSIPVRKLPSTEHIITQEENTKIDFDKIAKLISKDLRGGYIKENDIEYWEGFGLKRLYEYTQKRKDITGEAREIITKKIETIIKDYWNDYQNKDELPNLDIRAVFADYTPKYEYKGYLEGQKLFDYIAPYFNAKDRHDKTDIDYLDRFITEASVALGMEFDLNQSVDGLVCYYFVQSVQMKLDGK